MEGGSILEWTDLLVALPADVDVAVVPAATTRRALTPHVRYMCN